MRKSLYERKIKRKLDIFLSASALVILSPVMAVTAWQVRRKLGSPVLFAQLRPGKNEKIFKMYKFRTMTDERDEDGKLLPDEKRLTEFGRFLRSTSLDELPELINILKGDMSIVGPRPQLVRDMVFMTKEQRQRHRAAQGLTGLAQVNGRNNISWEDKLKYDCEYVKHITFLGDLWIVIRTIGNVLQKEDVNTEGMATAEDFGDYLLRTGQVDQETYDKKQRIARRLYEKAAERT